MNTNENGVLQLTPETIKAMVIGGNYKNKDLCISLSERLKMHAYGIMPESLITERRPNESPAIKDYRKKVYVPITKRPISKVISSLEKIRRSQDWNVQYKVANQSRIKTGETLQDYCEYNYPHFTSITNWAFSVLLRKYILDANGIIAIIPEEIPTSTTDYCKPVAKFFDSEQIVDYVEGEYVVLRSHDKTTYKTHGGRRVNTDGAIYYIITKTQFYKYEQVSSKEIEETDVYEHNIGMLPAFRAGGVFYARRNNDDIFESRISGMVPSLDEAVREYSDLQAEILQHIHSDKYMYANVECPVCNGTGRVYVKDEETGEETGEQKVCSHCKGRGSVTNVSPYGEYIISPSKFGEQSLPAPPIGYVQKSTDIAKFEDEHVRQHIYDALAAVNMEFLAETPLSQSGVAKAFDRDELNNFVNAIAEDIVHILDRVYYFINEYRYSVIIPQLEKRKELLPSINVPTKYDILNTSTLMAELKAARDAHVNPMILRELEIDYSKKQFNTSPEIARTVEITFDLDPLFGMTEESKMTVLQNNGITETDYIISCNVQTFVRRAIREHTDFFAKDYTQQMDILKKYADDVKKANEPAQDNMFKGLVDNKPKKEDEPTN